MAKFKDKLFDAVSIPNGVYILDEVKIRVPDKFFYVELLNKTDTNDFWIDPATEIKLDVYFSIPNSTLWQYSGGITAKGGIDTILDKRGIAVPRVRTWYKTPIPQRRPIVALTILQVISGNLKTELHYELRD